MKTTSIVLSLLIALGGSCAEALQAQDYHYTIPPETGDGWRTASLEDVGMDTERMVAFMNALSGFADHWIHGVVIAKDGRLVFEEYFPGIDLDLGDLTSGPAFTERSFDRTVLHSLASDTKSVTSILAGIAFDRGLLESTDQTVLSFFPDYSGVAGPRKQGITLEHVLTMTSGIPWTEAFDYDDPRNDLAAMVAAKDPLDFVLSKELEAAPGERFVYNSGMVNVLGEVIRRASGEPLVDFAVEHLFAPLGVDTLAWYPFPGDEDMVVASSSLFLRPRDMAKLGQLVLDGGVWNGTRIVSEEWVSRSTSSALPHVDSPVPELDPGYGYLWWTGTFAAGATPTVFAAGLGGQFVFVLPEIRAVVVVTAGSWEPRDYKPIMEMMSTFILPAAGR